MLALNKADNVLLQTTTYVVLSKENRNREKTVWIPFDSGR